MLKKGLSMLCAVLLIAGCFSFAEAAGMTTTVMVYMCGADLESVDRSASADLKEMISAGIAADGPVKVIVETGGAEKWHMRAIDSSVNMRFEITADGLKEVQRLSSSRNMGAASTLKDFIQFGVTKYPADRYFLILWNHGGGPLEGICFDELHDDDGLTMEELTQALKGGLGANKLDAVIFDACLMGSLEVAATMQPFALYMGASEDSEPGEGLNYKTWLKKLKDDPSISTRDLLETVSDSLVDTISASDPRENVTFSILDLQQLSVLTAAMDTLGRAASQLIAESPAVLTTVRESILSFGEYELDEEEAYPTDLVDIRLVCDLLESALPQETAAVHAALDRVVLFNDVSASMAAYACGVSVFWPAYTVSDFPEYLDLYPSVAAGTAWSGFAVKYGEEHAVSNGFHMYAGTNHNQGGLWGMLSDWWNSDDDDSWYDDNDDGYGGLLDYFGFGMNDGQGSHFSSGPVTAAGNGDYPGLWSDLPGYSGTGNASYADEGTYPGLWSDLPGYTGGTVIREDTPAVSAPGGSGLYNGLWDDLRK